MRSVLPSAAIAIALAIAPADAQTSVDSIGPRAGSWGAEAVVGAGVGAALLRVSSPRSAWVFGASFTVSRETLDEVTGGFPGTVERVSRMLGHVDMRAGRRWWSGDERSKLRPLTGLGIAGSLSHQSYARTWAAGAYGELGATWFFTPHVSLGASGELLAAYGQDRFRSDASTTRVNERWTLRGNLVRVGAGVYF